MTFGKKSKRFDLPRTMLAPMAGYTDAPTRLFAKEYGCGLTVTEMVSSASLVVGNFISKELLTSFESAPVAVQIFGHDLDLMARAAALDCFDNFDIIDINMGCPVRKIVSGGDGSALMDNPLLARGIVEAVKKSTDKPVSVKFRLGRKNKDKAVDFARCLVDGGADWLTLHGRTAEQMYSGNADKEAVCLVANAVSVPLFANGDVSCKADFDFFTQNGCYGVAVGRAAIGRPYVFAQLADKPYVFDVKQKLKEHFLMLCSVTRSAVAVNEMKKQIPFYLKGFRDVKKTIVACTAAKSEEEMLALIEGLGELTR